MSLDDSTTFTVTVDASMSRFNSIQLCKLHRTAHDTSHLLDYNPRLRVRRGRSHGDAVPRLAERCVQQRRSSAAV